MQKVAARITELVIKRINGELNIGEEKEFQDWINQSDSNRISVEDFLTEVKLKEGVRDLYSLKEKIWRRLDEKLSVNGLQIDGEITEKENTNGVVTMRRRFFWKWAAAAILIIVSITGYFTLFNDNRKNDLVHNKEQEKNTIPDIAPGQNKAVLILADGSKIVLDSASIGKLPQQGNTVVLNKDGQLVYNGKANSNKEVIYNTLATAKGETYSLTLTDGTKVWLNSASSIRFPVIFIGRERKVEIKGEAYFEVAKNANMPFIVKSGDAEVQVLGTHFNVNAYDDESFIKITLQEGAIKVFASSTRTSQLLSTGEQAQVNKKGEIGLIKNADVDAAVAWKNGFFDFNNADLTTVMRQLVRWYDVEVVYEGSVAKREFGGKLGRDLQLSQVLKILEKSEVHFRIEGKKLIVMP